MSPRPNAGSTELPGRGKPRLVFVKGANDEIGTPRWRRWSARPVSSSSAVGSAGAELTGALYASLVEHSIARGLRTKPFDAAACRRRPSRTSSEEARSVPRPARRSAARAAAGNSARRRARPSQPSRPGAAEPRGGAALRPRAPAFPLTSEVKCLHFHGTEVRKPIPSYQVYKGTVFELVDQAVDFVMSKLARRVGTRELSPQARRLRAPREAVAEAIVNAVAHRDYTSNASVQVMCSRTGWRSGTRASCHPSLTPTTPPAARLDPPQSTARRAALPGPLHRGAGTGTLDMIARCREAGCPNRSSGRAAGSS